MRFGALLVSVVSPFFLCVNAAPQAVSTQSVGGETLGAILNALNLGIVAKINTLITLDSLSTNIVSVNFDVKNPLILELTIDRVVSTAGINGTVYAKFDQTFAKPLVVPILGTANSGTFGNVLLTQGIDASLGIIPLGVLDLIKTDVYVRQVDFATVDEIPVDNIL
ncbi:hypothetical protein H0H81_008805 [Sphagnurus paluster]|uniref:Uncharacterized protein n=1 Tax=Sphagnurus paluster TaxID=117069 RepID=A0A9P7K7Z2_9AGAR|nr:hypothetical protein H0H81_008805 [Sphagnurus paluster]